MSLTAAALLFAPAAPGAVYWGEGGTVSAANLDGGNANSKYLQFHHLGGPTCDVAVSESHLYWCEWFGIWRVNFEGPATPVSIVPGLNNPGGIAIDGSHVYWTNRGAGAIGRAALDGSARNDGFILGLDPPCEVAVDGSYVYWLDQRGIGRARLDGSAVEEPFLPTVPGGCGLAVGFGYVYWAAGEGRIGRASLNGFEADPGFITGVGGVSGIALDDGHVYWADWREGMNYSTIGRADLDGSDVNRSWIATQTFNIGGVAVDSRPTPPPLPLPSRPIRFGQVRHNLETGAAVIDVWVPARGDLVLTAPKIGWKVLKGVTPAPYNEGSFRWRLKVWPGRTGFGAKVRKQLKNKGRAPLALRVSYAETGQLAAAAVKRITLLRRGR
jgi:virginiamycin B lyase